LLRVFGTIIAVAFLGLGVGGVLAMYWISGLLFVLVLFVREFLLGTVRPNFSLLKPMFVFAIPFLPGGLCTFIQINGDRFILAFWFDLETVGLYALAWKIAGCAAMLSALPMQRVWLVRQYEVLPTPEGPREAAKWCSLIVVVQLFVGLGVSLFCRELLMLIGKEEYWKAADLIPLLVLADVFLYANYFFEGPLFVYRRTSLKFLNALTATVAVLCLFTVLVPRYGGFGAATATVLGNVILAVGSLILTRKIRQIDYAWLALAWMLGLAVIVVWLGRYVDTFFDLQRMVTFDSIGKRLLALVPVTVTKIALLGGWVALVVRFR
jgi:O-antigen/teichoic acid export membrane protein